jgi:tRNA(Ile)-lysidine synthase
MLESDLLRRVAGIITRYNMAPRGSRIGVAVSGGADSVALLHILHRLAPELALQLVVLHGNHGLRGAESDEDEYFVRSLSHQLGLPLIVEHIPPLAGNLEQGAREARRSFFRRSMAAYSLERIALGHTRSDQAETVLFRLIRGSGLAGLAGMRFITEDGLVRPLLTTSRAEIRQWAASLGLEWREDSSNRETRFSRNWLRHEILPALAEKLNPNVETTLAETALLAAAEEAYWREQVASRFQRISRRTASGVILDVPSFLGEHIAVQRRLLRRAICEVRGDLRSLEMQHIEAILKVCGGSEAHDRVIVPGIDALRSYGKLLLRKPGPQVDHHYSLELSIGQEYELPSHAGRIYIEWNDRNPEFCANFKEDQEFAGEIAEFDGEVLLGAERTRRLSVRNWKPGDAIRLPGHAGAVKIKSLFQEHRVLLWERSRWPVLLSDGEIAWVRQFGSAAKFQKQNGTQRFLRLVYYPQE